MENGNFGVSELCKPWTEWLKSGIAHMIVLATWPRMPNFKFGRTGASGNIVKCTPRVLFELLITDYTQQRLLKKKITKLFCVHYGLKPTISNLGP